MSEVRLTRRTPSGEGGVAKLRLEGAGARALAGALLERELREGRLIHARLVDGDVLDEVLLRVAGERVELCTHGGERALARVREALCRRGAVEAGEEHDAVVCAATPRALDVALVQARGHVVAPPDAAAAARWGRAWSEGRRLLIAGPPNSGRSTLLNALAGRVVALVDEAPGTTRDRIEVTIDVEGVPVTCIDGPAVGDADALVWLARGDATPATGEGMRRLWIGAGAPEGWDAMSELDVGGLRRWIVADLGPQPPADARVPLCAAEWEGLA